MYWFGTDVPRDLKIAYVWYSLASQNNHYWGAQALQRVRDLLSEQEVLEANGRLSAWKPGSCEAELGLVQKH